MRKRIYKIDLKRMCVGKISNAARKNVASLIDFFYEKLYWKSVPVAVFAQTGSTNPEWVPG